MTSSTGVLLLNLGTPDNYTPKAVARYLREFLQDKRVINLPFVFRWILVNLLIVPFRAKKSAKSYQKIWTKQGSPLLVNSNKLADSLQKQIGTDYKVVLGMTYGKPSIKRALKQLSDCQSIKIVPLFPQYSSSASGAPIEQVLNILQRQLIIPRISILQNFYNEINYIEALANSVRPYLSKKYDALITSYHGLPAKAMDAKFYQEQCYATTKELCNKLNLDDDKCYVSFQSRLGKIPWIEPYTDQLLVKLAKNGLKNIIIVCPSFVVDCLETLEEIAIGCKEQWLGLGGESLELVPCLNSNTDWVSALKTIINNLY